MTFRRVCAGLGVLLFAVFCRAAENEALPEMRGIWLSRQVVSSGRTAMRSEFQRIRNAGFNAVFINNWYKGGMIYPSDVVESYGGMRQLPEYAGRDPLAEAIEEGHRLGIEIHVWFEYGLWNWLSYDSTDIGPVLSTRPDWLMRDREGIRYHIMWAGATPIYQFWTDPASPEVVAFMKEIYAECARNYPGLDGIQTDRIRYPSTGFSYSEVSRNAYMAETGGSDPLTFDASSSEWDNFVAWRERKTSDLAAEIYTAVKAENPGCLVSSAVAPPYMLEGGSDKLQDWPAWLREGSVDLVCPMLYNLSNEMDYWLGRCLEEVNEPIRFAAGIDIASQSESVLVNAVNSIRNRHFGGTVIWYYGDFTDDKEQVFRDRIFTGRVQAFHQAPTVDDAYSQYVSSNQVIQVRGGTGGLFYVGDDTESWFSWEIPLFVSGIYSVQAFIPEEWNGADSLVYELEINDSTELFAVSAGSGWITLSRRQFNGTDIVKLTVRPADGGIAADAVRLVRKLPLQISDIFTSGPETVNLRFNQPVNPEDAVNPEFYAIQPEIDILSAVPDPESSQNVILECRGMQPGTAYILSCSGIRDMYGAATDSLSAPFFYTSGLDTLIDNKDTYFTVQSGSWSSADSATGYQGEDYLISPAGDGSARVFWRNKVPETGYYRVSVLFPSGPEFVRDALYLLKSGTDYDTIRVNQQVAGIHSAILGTQWLEAGTYAVVKLHNDSKADPGKLIAADAVRFQRIFISSSPGLQPVRLPESFTVSANYPNPFNSTTCFHLGLPAANIVDFRIYNVKGQEIKQIRKQFPSGDSVFSLNFSGFPSGVYFYRAVSGFGIESGKMLYVQ